MSNLLKIIVILSLEKFSRLIGEICIFPEKNCTENQSLSRNLTELSIVHSFLTEMPSLDEYENLKILHLDHNQIHTLNRDYPSVEELSLNSNEIYSLHERNLKYFNLKILDLSHNPIEYIIDEYFSSQRFPKLEILILINALTELNPFLIHQRSISFSSLKHLTEIHFDQNQFESFSCSNNFNEIQWRFPSSIRKLNFAKNKLNSFDSTCFVENENLVELDFHWNYLKEFSSTNFILQNLTKLNLHSNFFDEISSNFLRSFPNLDELDLSNNPLELKKKNHFLPNFLKILRFNSINSEISCSLLKNLRQLEQFEFSNSRTKRVDRCLLKKQKHLKIVSVHCLDRFVFFFFKTRFSSLVKLQFSSFRIDRRTNFSLLDRRKSVRNSRHSKRIDSLFVVFITLANRSFQQTQSNFDQVKTKNNFLLDENFLSLQMFQREQ